MKKVYVVPQTEEMIMEPLGGIMVTSPGTGGLPEPAPRRRGDVIE